MASADERLKNLEEEMKLVKGEIQRTFVDLRAMLMNEESPFGHDTTLAQFAANSAMAESDSGSGVPADLGGKPGKDLNAAPEDAQVRAQVPAEKHTVEPSSGGLGELSDHLHDPASGAVLTGQQAPLMRDRLFDATPAAGVLGEVGSVRTWDQVDVSSAAPPAVGGRDGPAVRQDRPLRPSPALDDGAEAHARRSHPDAHGTQADLTVVNLFANFVRWVNEAIEKIGDQTLEKLLDLYVRANPQAIGLKEFAMHLASLITAGEAVPRGKADSAKMAEHLSELTTGLHGILNGGGPAPVIPDMKRDTSSTQEAEGLEDGSHCGSSRRSRPSRLLRQSTAANGRDGD